MSDSGYLELTQLIERLHRHFLDVLRTELQRLGYSDINAVQALLLFNIGREEVVIRDLKDRGYYHGSNVSYNIKKLVENGFLVQERSAHDRRSVLVRLTDRGTDLCDHIGALQDRISERFVGGEKEATDLEKATGLLKRLDRIWTDFIRYGEL